METGLHRLSAVWWGLWAVAGAIFLGATLFGFSSSPSQTAWFGLSLVVGAFVLHRLTCWVVSGFFAK